MAAIFTVAIAGYSSASPTIYSQGYVRAPFKASQYMAAR